LAKQKSSPKPQNKPMAKSLSQKSQILQAAAPGQSFKTNPIFQRALRRCQSSLRAR